MPILYGRTSGAQPTRVADATAQRIRLMPTGEQVVANIGGGCYGLTMEGAYFKAVNSTFNTAVAMNVATASAFSETQGSVSIRNSNTAGGKDICLDFIKITIVAAGTGNTNLNVVCQTDIITRYSSGGTALTPVNCNSGIANTTGAVVHAGALTLVTSSASAKKLAGGTYVVRAAAPAANDVILLGFGDVSSSATAPGAALAMPMGPVLLPAGGTNTFVLHLYSGSQTAAPTAWFEIGYYER